MAEISISNRMTVFPWRAGPSLPKAETATSSSSLITLSRCVAQVFRGTLASPGVCPDAVEIDFVIQQKHLSAAGYNVLAYDIRNHGNSSAANGGISGIGRWEWRDCVGVKKYVDSHPALSKMTVGSLASAWEATRSARPSTGGQICSRTFGACAVR